MTIEKSRQVFLQNLPEAVKLVKQQIAIEQAKSNLGRQEIDVFLCPAIRKAMQGIDRDRIDFLIEELLEKFCPITYGSIWLSRCMNYDSADTNAMRLRILDCILTGTQKDVDKIRADLLKSFNSFNA